MERIDLSIYRICKSRVLYLFPYFKESGLILSLPLVVGYWRFAIGRRQILSLLANCQEPAAKSNLRCEGSHNTPTVLPWYNHHQVAIHIMFRPGIRA
ncbi:MAG: hypothetical protein H6695_12150 [Deferribacteres bacterium]|nr:hypothetical protein [candidate division KSB1 bacterium]MCB9510933.1 hypothetical protein [Deferribacteres bacterium]